jgi:outer membrane protein TolC
MKLITAALLLAATTWATSLEDARQAALENHPSLGSAQSAVDAAEARLRTAKAGRMPQLGFSGISKAGLSGAMNGLNPIGIANSPFFRNFATGANVSHPGLDFGRTKSSIAIERERLAAAEADLKTTQAEVLLRVEKTFYDSLRTRAELKAVTQSVESRELTARQAKAFYEGEMRSKIEFGMTQVRLAATRAELIDAAGRANVAKAQLAYAMGVSPESIGPLDEPTSLIPDTDELDVLIISAYEQRPDILSLTAHRDGAVEVVNLAKAQRRPWLRVFFTGGWARFNPLQLSSLTAIGAGLAVPLLTFGRLEGEVEEAEALRAQSDLRLEELRQLVALETRIAYYAVRAASEKLPLREQQATLAAEAVRLARARYREQLGSLVELSQAESEQETAQAAAAAASYELQTALAELRFATGEMH